MRDVGPSALTPLLLPLLMIHNHGVFIVTQVVQVRQIRLLNVLLISTALTPFSALSLQLSCNLRLELIIQS